MPQIQVNDAQYYYQIEGQGAPLVLIAGYTCDHQIWEAMVPDLAQHYQVLTFDNRGIGQTQDSSNPFTIDLMAKELLMLCEQLQITQAYVIGQSMGGAIAQTIGFIAPHFCRKLVLINTVNRFSQLCKMALSHLLSLRALAVPTEYIIEACLPWLFCNQTLSQENAIPILIDTMLGNPYPQSVLDQTRQLHALKAFDAEYKSNLINVPTLVIAAEQDILTLPYESQLLANSIKDAIFKLIPGAHASPLEQPTLLVDIIQQFCQ
jgi:3-oxoadipate enol-lactonase